MEVKEVLHMNGGDGENSYAKYSTFQTKVSLATMPGIAGAVDSLLEEPFFPCELLNMADLGCAIGLNAFNFMSTVIEGVESNCRGGSLPEIQFYLNDLPGNDFNTLFKTLSGFRHNPDNNSLPFFVMGAPGSFHERIFPRNSLHLVHSSYSAHWLSRIPHLMTEEGSPLNKGKIYISKTSPPEVKQAYLGQFQQDLTNFLGLRSEEMVVGARLVLVIKGRPDEDPASLEACHTWDLLAEAISILVSEGLVEKEKLDTFDIPHYIASQEEVEEIVRREGSFLLDRIETFSLDIRGAFSEDKDPWIKGAKLAKDTRAITGSMIKHHLGLEETVMDRLYNEKLAHLMGESLSKEQPQGISIIIVLRKQE